MKFRAVKVRISTKSYKYELVFILTFIALNFIFVLFVHNVYNLRKNNFRLYFISHKKEALSSEVSKVNHSVMNKKRRRLNTVFFRKKTVEKGKWIHHSCLTYHTVDGLRYKKGFTNSTRNFFTCLKRSVMQWRKNIRVQTR